MLSHGGIASVVSAWCDAGVFERWPVMYLATHVEGSKLRKLIQLLRALVHFACLLTTGRVACLHAHVARQNSFWRKAVFMLLAQLAGRPVIVHMHSGGFPQFFAEQCGPLGRTLVRHFLDRADRLVVLSRNWEFILAGMTANRRITVIPNFVTSPSKEISTTVGGSDSAAISALPMSEAEAMMEQSSYLLFLGQLTTEKGFFDLLRAFAEVRAHCPRLRLKCGGDGNRVAVNCAVTKHGLDGAVDLLGWVKGERKNALLRGAVVLVLPSYQEGIPMSILEAMALCVPVVASAVGGIPDVIQDGVNGLLVEAGDTSAIARAVTLLATNKDLRARMAHGAAATVCARFSPQAVLPRLDDLYHDYGLVPQPGLRIESSA